MKFPSLYETTGTNNGSTPKSKEPPKPKYTQRQENSDTNRQVEKSAQTLAEELKATASANTTPMKSTLDLRKMKENGCLTSEESGIPYKWIFTKNIDGVIKYYYGERTGNNINGEIYYDYAETFIEGRAIVKEKGRYHFIDQNFKNPILPNASLGNLFEECYKFFYGKARVKKLGKYFFIDKSGKRLFPRFLTGFEYADDFSEGTTVVAESENKYIVINENGENIFNNIQFERAYPSKEGLILVKTKGKWYYLDRKLNPFMGGFEIAFPFENGKAIVVLDGIEKELHRDKTIHEREH